MRYATLLKRKRTPERRAKIEAFLRDREKHEPIVDTLSRDEDMMRSITNASIDYVRDNLTNLTHDVTWGNLLVAHEMTEILNEPRNYGTFMMLCFAAIQQASLLTEEV